MPKSNRIHQATARTQCVTAPGPTDRITQFGERISPQPNGCWIYNNTTGSYGQVKADGKTHPAHRFTYEILVGPVPDGHVLHHKCEVKACVNPAHLEPMTRGDHTRHHHEVV